MADPRVARVAALAEVLQAAHLDALLLSGLPNIRYLTGFSGSSALALVTARAEVLLVTDFRYQTQVSSDVGDLARVSIEAQSLWAGVWQLLPQYAHIEVVGFEGGRLLHRDFQRLLEAGQRWQWRPTAELVEGLRAVKDPGEVEAIRCAVEIAEMALAQLVERLRPGMTELEAAGLLENAMRALGSEAYPFETIVASGERAALPHARATARQLRSGEFLLVDFGAQYGGYCSDITRTFVIGQADAMQRDRYGMVRAAGAAARSGLRAGMRGRDADAMARDLLERAGVGSLFGHSLGHGIGLEVHEAPRLARAAEAPLPAGAVVTIEPGVYEAGWGGIRIEDDVHLTADGPVLLTSFTRELLEIA